MSEIVKLPIKKVYPRTVRGAEIWAQQEPREEMVWAVCPWLRHDLHRCHHCPRFEEDPDYGQVQRGCFGFAAEVCRVVFAMQARAALSPASPNPRPADPSAERTDA